MRNSRGRSDAKKLPLTQFRPLMLRPNERVCILHPNMDPMETTSHKNNSVFVCINTHCAHICTFSVLCIVQLMRFPPSIEFKIDNIRDGVASFNDMLEHTSIA